MPWENPPVLTSGWAVSPQATRDLSGLTEAVSTALGAPGAAAAQIPGQSTFQKEGGQGAHEL